MRFGDVELDFLGHSGFLVRHRRHTLVIDPYHVPDRLPLADIVLISHGHHDHCSIKDIAKIVRKGTLVFCSPDCQSSVVKVKDARVQPVEVHDVIRFSGFTLECVPAYNLNGKPHARSEGWLGFVLKFGRTIVYFAGDTDAVPEISRLSGHGKQGNTFVALLPVAGDVVMDATCAARVAASLKPTMSIPMSYGAGVYGTEKDAQLFTSLCARKQVPAIILPKFGV
jgi:L-ascorbate metabolism protein UlaG (beta-lactamase superfamily)